MVVFLATAAVRLGKKHTIIIMTSPSITGVEPLRGGSLNTEGTGLEKTSEVSGQSRFFCLNSLGDKKNYLPSEDKINPKISYEIKKFSADLGNPRILKMIRRNKWFNPPYVTMRFHVKIFVLLSWEFEFVSRLVPASPRDPSCVPVIPAS